MSFPRFQEEVRQALSRVADLRQRVRSEAEPPRLTTEALEELGTTLEELQVAEEELRIQNEELIAARIVADAERHRYQDLFEFAPIPFVVTDAEGVIGRANRAAVALFNVPGRRLPGKPLVLFVDQEDRRAFHGVLSGLLEGREANELTLRVCPRGEGAARVVLISALPQRDPGSGAVQLCWQMRDVTALVRAEREVRTLNEGLERRVRERTQQLEAALRDRQALLERERASRRRAEEAERLLRAEARLRDDFLAVLAHELRGPLAPLRQAAQVLSSPAADDPQGERARAVVGRQVDHLARLVDDLLDAARISRGKVTLRRERVDLTDVVRSVVDDHRAELKQAGVAVELNLPGGPAWVEGDPVRLAQVAGNLLHNAWKFTPRDGRVAVTLTTEEGRARVTVADTGAGIEPELLPHVFTMFAQGDRDNGSRSAGGLGLGLAVVRGLVEMHGGKVAAASAGRGQGSAFTFELPLCEGPAAAAPPPPEEPRAEAGPCRVLIIEDNLDTAETLAILLRRWGHETAVAGDGDEGVARARQFRPDLVICDLGLPGMSGHEVARRLKHDPATAACHLVAASGYGRDADRQESAAAGFEEHLTKPIDLDLLRRLLRKAARRG